MAEQLQLPVTLVDRNANVIVEITSGRRGPEVHIHDRDGNRLVSWSGPGGLILGGSDGPMGDLVLRNYAGDDTVQIRGNGEIAIGDLANDDQPPAMFITKNDITLQGSRGNQVAVEVKGADGGSIAVGGGDVGPRRRRGGNILVRSSDGGDAIHLDGATGAITAGGGDRDGDIFLARKDGERVIHLRARPDRGGAIAVRNRNGDTTVRLDGDAGDIRLSNGDCAEEFPAHPGVDAAPGTVMVLSDSGTVRPGTDEYDQRVAGIVSGAGDYRPAIVLDRRDGDDTRVPLALLGKAFCKADATRHPIRVGDPLTTSATTGCAMKATDPARAFGATLGKALAALPSGRGMIPVLVSLR